MNTISLYHLHLLNWENLRCEHPIMYTLMCNLLLQTSPFVNTLSGPIEPFTLKKDLFWTVNSPTLNVFVPVTCCLFTFPRFTEIPSPIFLLYLLMLAASSDNMARLWNVETGEVKREYGGHQKAVVCLAFRDDILREWVQHSQSRQQGQLEDINRQWQIRGWFWI